MSQAPDAAERQQLLKRALLELKDMRARLEEAEGARAQPIAIIGIGCRFPGGASSPARFWSLLHDGRDAVSEVPASRWDLSAYYDPDPAAPGKMYTRWGGFLAEDPALFDAPFFRVSPREAGAMDPQQRLLLEVSWEALEDAGALGRGVAGTDAGVFVGISTNDYAQFAMFNDPALIDLYTATGNALNAAAGRLAYFYGMQGPALAVDTACSSSLVAIHLACRSLRTGECSLAIAGGINLMLLPHGTVSTSRARMMARDGRCKTFDAEADGYVRGEGCGLVVLKRLADAQRDGDRVLAVVRGSAVNQDGASSALTVPNGAAQKALILQALEDARVEPERVSYLETHGTGTPLGDPIEIDSIKAALGPGRDALRPCALGSVKTNIGHLEAAAGVAGLIKVVLALGHREIPPHLHLKNLNPQISFDGTPFNIPTELTAWPDGGTGPRLAGVSSFGFSGTNAHVIVEEAPPDEAARPERERPLHVLTLSARTEPALAQLASLYASRVAEVTDSQLADIAYTANAGRSHFPHRLALVSGLTAQLAAGLGACARGEAAPGVSRGQVNASTRPRLAFLFTGQGSQYAGMGRELYDSSPVFRRALERCAELLKPHLEAPLLSVLFPAVDEQSSIDQTAYAQPALFALEWSLAELWRSWGIEPAVVLGHSVGEYVAACVAGVFSLEDALALIAERGRLMQRLPRVGAMAAVLADETRVREALETYSESLSVAAVNGPLETVVSGEAVALGEVLTKLEAEGIRARRLNVSHAFHSPLMEPMLDEFERVAAGVSFSPPRLRMLSNLSGAEARAEDVTTPAYWRRHAREAVRFADNVKSLEALGCTAMLEVGPQPVLTRMGRASSSGGDGTARAWLASVRRGRGEWEQMLESLVALYVNGQEVDWEGFDRGYGRRRTALPTYPFQRERHWHKSTGRKAPEAPARKQTEHPFLGRRLVSPLEAVQFGNELGVRAMPWVRDHRIYGMAWVNLVVYLELGLAACAEASGGGSYILKNVTVPHGLVLPDEGVRDVQTVLHTEEGGTSFRVYSLATPPENGADANGAGPSWTLHAAGMALAQTDEAFKATVPLQEIRSRCTEETEGADFYTLMRRNGIQLGPSIRRVEKIWRGEGESLCRLRPAHADAELEAGCVLPLGAIDACFQNMGALLPTDAPRDYLLTGLDTFTCRARVDEGATLWCHAALVSRDEETGALVGNLLLFEEGGRVVAEVNNARLQRVGVTAAHVQERLRGESGAAAGHVSADSIRAAEPGARHALLVEYILCEMSRTLQVEPSGLSADAPLVGQLDSLTAVELKTRIEFDLGVEVPVAVFFDGNSADVLASLLLEQLSAADEDGEESDASEVAGLLASLEGMSEEEARGLLVSAEGARADEGADA